MDIVALTALIAGAISFFAPYVMLKPNRVVDGDPVTGAALGGPAIITVSLIIGFTLLSIALLPGWFDLSPQYSRWPIHTASGIFCVWLCAGLLAKAGTMGAQRVSPAWGFWGLPAAAYIFISHAGIPKSKGRHFLLAIVMLVPVILIMSGGRAASLAVVQEFLVYKARFLTETISHLRLFTLAVIFAAALGIPLGILASRRRKLTEPVLSFVDGAQTIPSLAMFGLLMAPLAALSRTFPVLRTLGIKGIGDAPALIALSLYAMLPVVRNTVAGLASVPEPVLETGRGMGMSARQLFKDIKWPMALPYILAGLRTASVQAVGNTAVAALIGAGGLGILIFQGLGQAAPDLILLGVIPLVILAVSVDRIWGLLMHAWVSPGLGLQGGMQ